MAPKGEGRAFLEEHLPLPDSVEVRLLLAQNFSNKVEWAANIFCEQEIGGGVPYTVVVHDSPRRVR